MASAGAHGLRSEYCIQVTGTVGPRPDGNENPELPTGEIEVTAERLEVLSEAAPLPFQIDERRRGGRGGPAASTATWTSAGPAPAAALRLRQRSTGLPATCWTTRDFVEIETPTLTRSTPEGARDFLVPARLRPGSWYALPQSPQLFKQLLMVAGMERYYQIARCYRDEDFRADRQPEFTQLDIEMSFVDQDDVIALAEDVVAALWALVGHEIPTADPADDVRRGHGPLRLGQARPAVRARDHRADRRIFADTPFRVFQAPYVGAVVQPGGADTPRRDVRRLAGVGQAARAPRAGLRDRGPRTASSAARSPRTSPSPSGPGWPRRSAPSPATRSSSRPAHAKQRAGAAGRDPAGDRPPRRPDRRVGLVVRLGRRRAAVRARRGRGRNRRRRGRLRGVDGGAPRVHLAASRVWTPSTPTRAPRWPMPTTSSATATRSAAARSVSIARDIQERVFAMMGLGRGRGPGEVRLPARRVRLRRRRRTAGSPSAGTASCMLLAGADSIREVIAFPKSGGGYDPLTAAPAPITAAAAQGGRRRREARRGVARPIRLSRIRLSRIRLSRSD